MYYATIPTVIIIISAEVYKMVYITRTYVAYMRGVLKFTKWFA